MFKATALEFRLRLWISAFLIVLGFWAPWGMLSSASSPAAPASWLNPGHRQITWLWLAAELNRIGITGSNAIQLVTWMGIAVAAVAALLRLWGTACLGASTVNNAEMKAGGGAGQINSQGPYRFVRNPLYMGSWLMTAALGMLMPPSGALVSLLLLTIFLLRIIFAEEAFLAARLGQPYLDYCRAVPRLIPRLRSQAGPGNEPRHWGRALLAEITPVGILLSYAALSWQYDAWLLIRAALVSFGLSLVVRALLLPATPPAQS